MIVIIPMSGIGKRFLESGYSVPKPLIEIEGKPMIHHVIDLFPGENKFFFICNSNHLSTTNMREILLQKCKDATIFEIEEHSLGPVFAVSKIFDFIPDEEEVIISYCDYGTEWNYSRFSEQVRSGNYDGGIAAYRGFHPHMLGKDNYAFIREENNELLEIREKKPFTEDRMQEFASNGTYYFKNGKILKKYFSSSLSDERNSIGGEFYVSVVYNLLVRDGLRVSIFEIEKMLQWGTPGDLETYLGWSKIFSEFSNFLKIQNESEARDITLILPMAGEGSRFRMMGYSLPKPLLPVTGEKMITKAVKCLPKCKNNIFACGDTHLSEYPSIQEELISTFENSTIVPIEHLTSGQAETCMMAIEKGGVDLNSPILISACDNGIIYDTVKCDEMLRDESIDVIVWAFRGKQTSDVNPNMYAYLNVSPECDVLDVSNKKFVKFHEGSTPLNTHAIIGTMFFRKARYFVDGYKENVRDKITTKGEYYVDDVINRCIEYGLKVKVFDSDYICWGTPNDYKTYIYWEEHFSKK